MICRPCRDGVHTDTAWEVPVCPGEGHCDCQHRPPSYAGTCGAGAQPCGQPARLYACGWRCDRHKP